MDKNDMNSNNAPSSDNAENKRMEIEITRYKGFIKAFNNPNSLAKLIIVVSLIIVLVFTGISIIALVVKSYYPYRTVNSNEYGATIIQNEDNEVIYWLFNSADLWANSGIHVKKGDVISVRASGAFNSSIHHLVDEAKKNKVSHKWINPIGGPNSNSAKDNNRSEYRISKTHDFNTFLMQVVPDDVRLKDNKGEWISDAYNYIDGTPKIVKNNNNTIDHEVSIYPDIYAIGSERDKLTIRTDGVMHFAVNDIALTPQIITKMKNEVKIGDSLKDMSKLKIGKFPLPENNEEEVKLLNGLKNIGYTGNDSCVLKIPNIKGWRWDEDYRSFYNVISDEKPMDSIFLWENYTELDYYLISNWVDAWFADNVGSFLIVIERKKHN